MGRIQLVALSGSLRKASYNTAAINALKILAPGDVEISIGDISNLPLFNPDREIESIQPLNRIKHLIRNSTGLIISSPEYAHGISGPLKNSLDWLVSGDEFPNMPIMLINTSPRASHALEALKEVLRTMSGNIVERSFVSIALLGSGLDTNGILDSVELSGALQQGLAKFCNAIRTKT